MGKDSPFPNNPCGDGMGKLFPSKARIGGGGESRGWGGGIIYNPSLKFNPH